MAGRGKDRIGVGTPTPYSLGDYTNPHFELVVAI